MGAAWGYILFVDCSLLSGIVVGAITGVEAMERPLICSQRLGVPTLGPGVEAVDEELKKQTIASGETPDLDEGVLLALGPDTVQCKVTPLSAESSACSPTA